MSEPAENEVGDMRLTLTQIHVGIAGWVGGSVTLNYEMLVLITAALWGEDHMLPVKAWRSTFLQGSQSCSLGQPGIVNDTQPWNGAFSSLQLLSLQMCAETVPHLLC